MKKKALLEDRLCSSPHVGLQKSNLEREKCPRRSKPESEEQMDYLQPPRSLRETAENIKAKNHYGNRNFNGQGTPLKELSRAMH